MNIKDIKTEGKKAHLIFEFFSAENIDNKEILLINSIKIMGKTIKVDFDKSSKYEYILNDNIEDEYKKYECLFEFEKEHKISYTVSIYFNQINIFFCGKVKKKNSAEIIFCNFIDKKICIEDCFIIYNKIKFEPLENFDIETRRRINLLNIDITELEVPDSIDNVPFDRKTLFTNSNSNNFQVLISVSNKSKKAISIFENQPNIEPTIMNTDSIIALLEKSLESVNNILNYKAEYKTFNEYMNNINNDGMKELSEYIKTSESLENKVSSFFTYYRENPTEKELKIYDLFSEFMIAFPSLKNYPRNDNNVYTFRYIIQYYYSKKSIAQFVENIPDYVTKKEKIFLKYSACCTLRYLLYNGYGDKTTDLFYFLDYTKKGTIYNEAIEHNKKFVNFLNEHSEMFLYFLELNSGSSKDLITLKLSSRISMINCAQVKAHLLSTIPSYGIRLDGNSHFNAVTILETRTTCISEIKLFNKFLKDISCDIDCDYYYRYRLSTLLKHEEFGHIKFSLNYLLYNELIDKLKRKSLEPLSPIRYYKVYEKEGTEEIMEANKEQIEDKDDIKGESGIAIEFFLVRGDTKLINALRTENKNSKQIFENPELMSEDSLINFINLLSEGQVNNNKLSHEIKGKEKYSLINDFEGVTFGFPRREKY